MMDMNNAPPLRTYEPGERFDAEYDDNLVPPDFRHNPLIEAMAPDGTEAGVLKTLLHRPTYDPRHRFIEDPMKRIHLIDSVTRFFMPLPKTWELATLFSRAIRQGYVSRNPLYRLPAGELRAMMEGCDPSVTIPRIHDEDVRTFAAIGSSGIGKSTNVYRILCLQPQVIMHTIYRNGVRLDLVQVVYLKIDCPKDRSLKSLGEAFFRAVDELLGTNYYGEWAKGKTEGHMIIGMGVVARIINLGTLVLDEIQFLAETNRGNLNEVLNFLTILVNKAKIPIVFVGTHKAHKILGTKTRLARRSCGFGDFEWDQIEKGPDWDLFLRALWRYNYLAEDWPTLPPKDISDVLWHETQGVTDFVVKVFLQAQIRAIHAKNEIMTPHLIETVSIDRLRMARPLLLALQSGDANMLQEIDDIDPIALQLFQQRALEEIRTVQREAKARTTDNGGVDGVGSDEASAVTQTSPVFQRSPQATGTHDVTATVSDAPRRPRSQRAKADVGERAGTQAGFPKAIAVGKKRNLTAYQSLIAMGYVGNVDEFMPREVAS